MSRIGFVLAFTKNSKKGGRGSFKSFLAAGALTNEEALRVLFLKTTYISEKGRRLGL